MIAGPIWDMRSGLGVMLQVKIIHISSLFRVLIYTFVSIEAIVGVLSTINIKRNGMWVIGDVVYYQNLLEYSSWATLYGYPYARMTFINESRTLLHALARNDELGASFRKVIMYKATTVIGDGVNFVNKIGALGEYAFTADNGLADFTCTGEMYEACEVLKRVTVSSGSQCLFIENSIYQQCLYLIKIRNTWVTSCSTFATSMSTSGGIQCDQSFVYGNPHPQPKKTGNTISKMLLSLSTI